MIIKYYSIKNKKIEELKILLTLNYQIYFLYVNIIFLFYFIIILLKLKSKLFIMQIYIYNMNKIINIEYKEKNEV